MQYVNLLMCAVCSYVTLMRDLHICSIIVKIYATYVLHISIFVREVSSISKMTLELYLGRAPSPLAEHATNIIIAELGRNVNVRSSA